MTDPDHDLDMRRLRPTDKCPSLFAKYADLPVGGSFVLVSNDDPGHLREEFDADLAGTYGWQYLDRGPAVWRIRISKLSAVPLQSVPTTTHNDAASNATVSAWRRIADERAMEWGVTSVAPFEEIDLQIEAEVDVVVQVLAGSGRLTTEVRTVDLTPGNLVWLPRRLRRRQLTAGPRGLRYAMIHENP